MSKNKPLNINELKSPKKTFLLDTYLNSIPIIKHQVLERWVEGSGDLFKINFVGKEFLVSSNPDFSK